MRMLVVFFSLLVFRTVNALFCVASFVPDEYWQALEVAHWMVFGYGYLTWEWQEAIRGFSHPLLYATLYKVLAMLNLDYPALLVALPRVLHVPFAVVNDLYVMKLTTHLYGDKAGLYALLINVSSWFTFYCITRTLSNSVETGLTPVILYYWMAACEAVTITSARKYTRTYLLVVGVSLLVRPTGMLLWAPLVLAHLAMGSIKNRMHCLVVMQEMFMIGVLVLTWSVCIDYFFYGKLVFVQWNFFKFNVLEGHSALYGTHSWHWYWTEGVPVLLFTSLPMTLLGVWLPHGGWWKRAPFLLSLWELLFHSCLSHKEHRFIFPIVPIASIYAGYCVCWTITLIRSRDLHAVLLVLVLANIPMAVYFSQFHQSGSTAVMHYLRNDLNSNSSVLYLMPCHTTPFYSHIHEPLSMEFLECPPPISPDLQDVAEIFYRAPEQWLSRRFGSNDSFPTHLVLFNTLLPRIEAFITRHHYEEVVRVFHTHFTESERYGTHIVVLRKW